MTDAYQQRVDIIRRTLECNGVLGATEEIQYGKRFRAVFGFTRVTVQVFHTGSILVQGKVSSLEQWLMRAKQCIEAGKPIPNFMPPDREHFKCPSESAATGSPQSL
jgi:hypothetical protein